MVLVELGTMKRVKQYFPQRGDSFLPCDRDFGLITRVLRRADRIVTVHQNCELIKRSSVKKNKYKAVKVTQDSLFNWKRWWLRLFKTTYYSDRSMGNNVPRDENESVSVSKYFCFE
ncbi:hypothetical protein PR048_022646 [Dryococelus australis]|uniref:Uncharacterized protein n=1 Tax=Dryococelus australis TaxID=614101 RepID=A0ABQ9H1N0_9NEOP|nr:hypothetical protein PR048_022646 [Dryococelus australis]